MLQKFYRKEISAVAFLGTGMRAVDVQWPISKYKCPICIKARQDKDLRAEMSGNHMEMFSC